MPESLANLTAAVLVGGFGTRLRAVLPGQQKVLAPVAGRPFLMRILDQLSVAGVRRVVLCTGHQSDQVIAAIGNTYRNMVIQYSAEPTPLGTAGALRGALPLFAGDPVLVLNGDSFCDVDLAAFARSHAARRAQASLVVTPAANTQASGRITFDAEDQITCFTEKSPVGGPGWINAGLYLLSPQVLVSIPVNQAVSIEREVFPNWVGHGLYAFRTTGKFLDIGTPESYSTAQQVFL